MKGLEALIDAADMLRISDEHRALIRARVRAMSARSADADEVVDLSLHAVDQALRTLFTVLDRASRPDLSFVAIGIAAPMLASHLKTIISCAEEVSRKGGFEPRKLFPNGTGGAA